MFALQHAPGTDQAPSMAFLQVTFDGRTSAYFVREKLFPASFRRQWLSLNEC